MNSDASSSGGEEYQTQLFSLTQKNLKQVPQSSSKSGVHGNAPSLRNLVSHTRSKSLNSDADSLKSQFPPYIPTSLINSDASSSGGEEYHVIMSKIASSSLDVHGDAPSLRNLVSQSRSISLNSNSSSLQSQVPPSTSISLVNSDASSSGGEEYRLTMLKMFTPEATQKSLNQTTPSSSNNTSLPVSQFSPNPGGRSIRSQVDRRKQRPRQKRVCLGGSDTSPEAETSDSSSDYHPGGHPLTKPNRRKAERALPSTASIQAEHEQSRPLSPPPVDAQSVQRILAQADVWSSCAYDDVIKTLAPGEWVDGGVLDLYLRREWYECASRHVVYLPVELGQTVTQRSFGKDDLERDKVSGQKS